MVVWYWTHNVSTTYLTPKLKEGETVDLSLYLPRERTNIRLYGLNCKDWTPQDVFEYKRKWAASSEPVVIRGGLDRATRWCRTHLYQQDFYIEKFARPDDSHIVHFKSAEDAMIFKLSFNG